jgi:hypothetical protein
MIAAAACFVLAAALVPLVWALELRTALGWARLRRVAYKRRLFFARLDAETFRRVYAAEREQRQTAERALLDACRWLELQNAELEARRDQLVAQLGERPKWHVDRGSS